MQFPLIATAGTRPSEKFVKQFTKGLATLARALFHQAYEVGKVTARLHPAARMSERAIVPNLQRRPLWK